MGGERRIWPHDATHSITVRATTEQYYDWLNAARSYGTKSTGFFLSICGDRAVKAMKKEREGKP